MKFKAYLFALINTSTMTVECVRIMSDSNPTLFAYDEAWLKISSIEGCTYDEASRKMAETLQPGGFNHKWHKAWDQKGMFSF